MSEWFYNYNKPISKFLKSRQEQIDNFNPRRKLTVEEAEPIHKIEAIADKLKRRENVQNSGWVIHYLHTNYVIVLNAWY